MSVEQVLSLLLNSLSIERNKLTLSWAAVNLWQEQTFNLLLENKLITPTNKANNIQCQACDNKCSVDVIVQKYPSKTRYYAVCDDPIMHDQMGRITIEPEQLKQWKISIKQVAVVVSNLLGLTNDISCKAEQRAISLGALKSKAGRKSVVLNVEPLALVINQTELPLNELLYFDANKLALDMDRIEHALNLKQQPAVKAYHPNTGRKVQRKANTQAMYQSWQDKAIKLKKKHPHMSKTWVSQQIAKLPIAEGKSAETIRKNIQI